MGVEVSAIENARAQISQANETLGRINDPFPSRRPNRIDLVWLIQSERRALVDLIEHAEKLEVEVKAAWSQESQMQTRAEQAEAPIAKALDHHVSHIEQGNKIRRILRGES